MIHKIYNFNLNYQREFDFIQAKFMAYTDSGVITNLKNDQKLYYDSIQLSKSGNLLESLKKINLLISKNKKDYFIAMKLKQTYYYLMDITKKLLNFIEKFCKFNQIIIMQNITYLLI